MSLLQASLAALTKPQVDAIVKAARLAADGGQSSVLVLLMRLEELLLLPKLGEAKPDTAKVTAAVATFGVVDQFMNAKKQAALGLTNISEITNGLTALLPGALGSLRSGRKLVEDPEVATPPEPSAAQQSHFSMFLKQVEPFIRQWPQAQQLLTQLKGPLVAPTTASTQPQASSSNLIVTPPAIVNRITSSEAKKRAHVLALVTELANGLSNPKGNAAYAQLPPHRCQHHLQQLRALLHSAGPTEGDGKQSKAFNSCEISAAAMFESLTILHQTILEDLKVYEGSGGSKALLEFAQLGKRQRDDDAKGDDDDAGRARAVSDDETDNAVSEDNSSGMTNVTPITLESDVARYAPLTYRLASACVPPAGSAGSGYLPPHVFGQQHVTQSILGSSSVDYRSFEASLIELRDRLTADVEVRKSLKAIHGIALQANTSAPNAYPPHFIPPPVSSFTQELSNKEERELTAQQRSDRNGFSMAVASMGGHRAFAFVSSNMLVFPVPEGTPIRDANAIVGSAAHSVQAVQTLRTVKERQAAQGSGGISIQRAWAPSEQEWVGARDMLEVPMLRFK